MSRFLKVMPRLPVADLATGDRVLQGRARLQGQVRSGPRTSPVSLYSTATTCVFSFTSPIHRKEEPVGHGTLSFDVDDALALHADLERHATNRVGPGGLLVRPARIRCQRSKRISPHLFPGNDGAGDVSGRGERQCLNYRPSIPRGGLRGSAADVRPIPPELSCPGH